LELSFEAAAGLLPLSPERSVETEREADCPEDLFTDSFPLAACGLETGFAVRVAGLSERVAVLFDRLTGAGADLAALLSPVELVPDLTEYAFVVRVFSVLRLLLTWFVP